MHPDIAVVLECSGNGEAGGKRATEGINKHIDGLTLVGGKHRVNGIAVELKIGECKYNQLK